MTFKEAFIAMKNDHQVYREFFPGIIYSKETPLDCFDLSDIISNDWEISKEPH